MEKDQDKQLSRLNRKNCQVISVTYFSELEGEYLRLKQIHSRFNHGVDDLINLLATNEEGNPIYQGRGLPGSRFNPANLEIASKATLLEEAFKFTQDVLAHFIVSLPADEQITMVQQAMLPLFKNLDAVKAYTAAQSIGNV